MSNSANVEYLGFANSDLDIGTIHVYLTQIN